MSQLMRSQAKDGDFFDKVRPHMNCLVCRACQILGSEDLAWDAVQETLLTLWQERDTPRQVRGWLLRSVTHRSLHLKRTHGRRRKHEEGAAAQRRECDRCDPVHALADQELHSGLEEAIAKLPDDYRIVFRLREVEGLDYHTIAARLRIPLGTVQSRLNRARSALRMLLGPQFQAAHDCWLCGSRDHGPAQCTRGRHSVETELHPATSAMDKLRKSRPGRNTCVSTGTSW